MHVTTYNLLKIQEEEEWSGDTEQVWQALVVKDDRWTHMFRRRQESRFVKSLADEIFHYFEKVDNFATTTWSKSFIGNFLFPVHTFSHRLRFNLEWTLSSFRHFSLSFFLFLSLTHALTYAHQLFPLLALLSSLSYLTCHKLFLPFIFY